MNVEAMGGLSINRETGRRLVRSALLLIGAILAVAVPLLVLALTMQWTGTAGPWGVVAAAAICLIAGLAADGIGALLHSAGSPLGAMLGGMAMRLLPPLVVCLFLATQGGGREHLAFVVYLLTFYLVTLAVDTWLAVQRTARAPSNAGKRSA